MVAWSRARVPDVTKQDVGVALSDGYVSYLRSRLRQETPHMSDLPLRPPDSASSIDGDLVTDLPLHMQPEVHQRRWFLLGVLCLSLVMVVMAVSSLNVAIPTIQRELGASPTTLQWIVDAYALVFAGLLLTAGAIGDRFGRKKALLTGLAVFGAGALVSGLAGSASVIIVGRGIQGIGAALVMPATLSLITAVFPPEERQRAIATWVGFAGAGGAIGPIVTGALLERFWWGSAFLVNVPVIIVTAVAVAMYSPESRDDAATPLDPRGAILSLTGLGALLFGIIEGPNGDGPTPSSSPLSWPRQPSSPCSCCGSASHLTRCCR
jgi:MFS family permease